MVNDFLAPEKCSVNSSMNKYLKRFKISTVLFVSQVHSNGARFKSTKAGAKFAPSDLLLFYHACGLVNEAIVRLFECDK